MRSQPYSLPDWLPSVLALLAKHVDDPNPIKQDVKNVFSEFHRTHKDDWDKFKEKFSEEELGAVDGVAYAPSYFA